MNDSRRRRQMLWGAILGGALLLAIFFISAVTPKAGPQATEPTIHPVTDSSLATLGDTPSAQSNGQSASQSASQSAGKPAAGFSLGGGDILDLAWRLGLVIIVIAVSIVGLRWWTRRTAGPRSTTGLLRVVDTLAIGTGRSIHLVSIGDRVIAIGATAQQLSFLNELSEDEAERIRLASSHGTEQHLAGFAAELFNSMRRTGNNNEGRDHLSTQEVEL